VVVTIGAVSVMSTLIMVNISSHYYHLLCGWHRLDG
jgi:hypothetical protein